MHDWLQNALPLWTLRENINILLESWWADHCWQATKMMGDLYWCQDTLSKAEQFKFRGQRNLLEHNDNNMFSWQWRLYHLQFPELKPVVHQRPILQLHLYQVWPNGKYSATGSADVLVGLWDVDELVCSFGAFRLDWPGEDPQFCSDGKCWHQHRKKTILLTCWKWRQGQTIEEEVQWVSVPPQWRGTQKASAGICLWWQRRQIWQQPEAGTVKLFWA